MAMTNQNVPGLSETTAGAWSVEMTVMTLGDANALGTRMYDRWIDKWEAVGVHSLSVPEPTQNRF